MKIHAPLIAASLLLLPQVAAIAGDLKTIPVEVFNNMKKGKKLSLVWANPGFDGSKGCTLGALTNETDTDVSVVLESFPGFLRPVIREDSPYRLNMAVVSARIANRPNSSMARVEVEGKVVDKSGALVAAFDALVTSTIGGNANDNARMAVREISFGIAKDLFTVGIPTHEKPSAVIVAATPAAAPSVAPGKEKPSAIIVAMPTAPAVVSPAPAVPQASSPTSSNQATPVVPPTAATQPTQASMAAAQPAAPVPTPPAAAPSQPTSVVPPAPIAPPPTTTAQPVQAPMTAAQSAAPVPPPPVPASPKPAAVEPEPMTPLTVPLPSSITEKMKKGAALGRLWISPGYDRSKGFSIGEVRYLVDERNPGVTQFLPDALNEIAKKDAPYALYLGIVELSFRSSGKGVSTAKLSVEGRLVAQDGTVAAAFTTRETVAGTGDVNDDCRAAARRVVQAISQELR